MQVTSGDKRGARRPAMANTGGNGDSIPVAFACRGSTRTPITRAANSVNHWSSVIISGPQFCRSKLEETTESPDGKGDRLRPGTDRSWIRARGVWGTYVDGYLVSLPRYFLCRLPGSDWAIMPTGGMMFRLRSDDDSVWWLIDATVCRAKLSVNDNYGI